MFSFPGVKSTASPVTCTPGRSESTDMLHYFEIMCAWFESEMVPVTTVELHVKMVELAGEDEVYSFKHMTWKLEKQYGKDIVISKQDGKLSIVCFSNIADYINLSKTKKYRSYQNVNESSKQQQN